MLNEERGKIWSLPYIHSRPQLKLQRSREPLSNYLPDLHRTAGWTLLLWKPKPKLKYLPSTFEEKKRERKKMKKFCLFSSRTKTVFSLELVITFVAIFVVLLGSAHKTEDRSDGWATLINISIYTILIYRIIVYSSKLL